MTSIIKVQTLTGSDGETPHCHLLQVSDWCVAERAAFVWLELWLECLFPR